MKNNTNEIKHLIWFAIAQASYLAADAENEGDQDSAEYFRDIESRGLQLINEL